MGRLGRALIEPPSEFGEFYERISEANADAFTPPYQKLGVGQADSVWALSPEQPPLQVLSKLTPSHPVRVHTIIGNRGKPGPVEGSSDGIVEYWSSHLDFADSEKVVPADHFAFRHPEGQAEIVRILKLPRGE